MDEPGLLWIAVGLVLMVFEILLPGAFMLWLGVAAVGAGLASRLLLLGFDAQVIVFAALAPLSVGVALLLRRRKKAANPGSPGVNEQGSGLVGRTATALIFHGSEGRVRLGDSDWPARILPGEPIPEPSAPLHVVAVEGVVLLVRGAG